MSKFQDYTFDVVHGTDTGGSIDQHLLDNGAGPAGSGTGYQALRSWSFRRVMRDVDPARRGFVDFGCGKGKALMLASHLGFRRVVGVEIARDLVSTARSNVENGRWLGLSGTVAIVEGDARTYVVTSDDHVFFMFNPFDWTVMEAVLTNVVMSVHANPRDAWIVYQNPVHAGDIDAHGGFELLRRWRFAGEGRDIDVYRVREEPVFLEGSSQPSAVAAPSVETSVQ